MTDARYTNNMYKRMVNFLHWCIQGEDFHHRNKSLLCTALLVSSILAFISLSINYSLHFPPILVGLNAFFCIVYPILYWRTRFTSGHEALYANAFIYLTLVFLFCSWPLNGGVIGSVPLFLIGIVILSAFVLESNKAYLRFIGILLVVFCSLLSLDIFVPDWLFLYPDLGVQTLDMGLATLFLLMLCSLSLAIFRNRYEKERRALERSVAYKSRFLAQMSHEVRTPLNAILGFSKLLKANKSAQTLDVEQQLYLQRIHENGLSLLAFFDDLLDISKIEEGQLRLHLQKEINLSELLAQCVSHYQFSINDKALDFQQHSSLPEPCLLDTDPQRLKQMISNLLSNAIKFTPPQGRVSLNTFQEKSQLCIEVQDSGPGIKKSEQELVFTPFYRDNSRAAGSGLGLAIIKELCDLMGYQLRLKSKEGQGSCFQIWIPL